MTEEPEDERDRARYLAVADAYLNAPMEEKLMPGSGQRVTMFDGIIPEHVRRWMDEAFARGAR